MQRVDRARHQGRDIAARGLGVGRGDRAFVGGHAGQRQLAALGLHGIQDGAHAGRVARAGAAAADFDQHVDWPPGFPCRGRQRAHRVGGVREGQQAGVGIGRQQLAEPAPLARPPISLPSISLRTPARSSTAACCRLATVAPQAPASSRRCTICGDMGVACGASAAPWPWT